MVYVRKRCIVYPASRYTLKLAQSEPGCRALAEEVEESEMNCVGDEWCLTD